MVPSRRTRHGHGNRERRHKPGQHFRAASIHLDRVYAGMAGLLRHHGRTRVSLAAFLVPDLSAAKASRHTSYAGLENLYQRRDEIQAGLGLWPREVPYGSSVVVLSILAPYVPH